MKKTVFFLAIFLIFLSSMAMAQTKSITVPATAFKPMTEDAEYYTGESYSYPRTTSSYNHWGAAIPLPHDAKIVKITMFYADPTGSQITLHVIRTNLYTGDKTDHMSVTSDSGGSYGNPVSKSTSGYMRVNMSGYEHTLWLDWGGTGSGLYFWGVKIVYNE